jgi:uncharacterized membrane protein YkvA (DUF1232 family)
LIESVKRWASMIKRDVVALWHAARDRRVPWLAKAVAAAVAAYALSPIDLIPDFVPILGYLDDLVIVPIGIMLAVRLVPANLMEEFRNVAMRRDKPVSKVGATFIVGVWVTSALLLVYYLWPLHE